MASHNPIFKRLMFTYIIFILLSCGKDNDLFFETILEGEIGDGVNPISFQVVDDVFEFEANVGSIVLDVLENDSIPTSNSLTVRIIRTSESSEGSLQINEDNTLLYAPFQTSQSNGDESISDTFSYTIEVEMGGLKEQKEADVTIRMTNTEDVTSSDDGESNSNNDGNMGQLMAFPGAEGFGRYTSGGRGGLVYHVTNLNDNGFGSFRDAVSSSNRIIVFDISGTITINTDLYIKGSNLTIAGETAPGDGIAIYGDETIVEGDNIIIRHLRFRNGENNSEDTFRILGSGYSGTHSGYMIDHCSFSWGDDETVSIETGDASTGNVFVSDVTFQNCIISEGFDGKNMILYGGNQTEISVLKCYFANTADRSLRSNQGSSGGNGNEPKKFEFNDNYIYNFSTALAPEFGAEFDAIGNVFDDGVYNQLYGTTISLNGPNQCNNCKISETRAFIRDNVWNGSNAIIGSNFGPFLNNGNVVTSGYSSMGSSNVKAYVLNNVGARVGISGLDNLDQEMIDDSKNGTGSFVSNMNQTSGLPVLYSTSRSATYDTDGDGMADSWEIQSFGTLANGASGDENDNGYTNIEEFFYYLVSN